MMKIIQVFWTAGQDPLKSYSRSRKRLAASLFALLLAATVFGMEQKDGQIKCDTLLYHYHYAGNDAFPDMLPEDCHMELYVHDGIVGRGVFWGTTDIMDDAREGYECGFFVLPMVNIVHGKDSISFTLKAVTGSDGRKTNTFVSAPVDLHVRQWKRAVTLYKPWESFPAGIADSVTISILPVTGKTCLLADSIIVQRRESSCTDKMIFVRRNEK